MARETEPQLTVDGATDEQQHALSSFVAIARKDPAAVIDALSLLRKGTADSEVQKPYRNILGVIELVMETEVDLDMQPDPTTVEAMRRAIKDVTPDERRPARLAVFAMAVQDWQEQHPIQIQSAAAESEAQEQQANSSAA